MNVIKITLALLGLTSALVTNPCAQYASQILTVARKGAVIVPLACAVYNGPSEHTRYNDLYTVAWRINHPESRLSEGTRCFNPLVSAISTQAVYSATKFVAKKGLPFAPLHIQKMCHIPKTPATIIGASAALATWGYAKIQINRELTKFSDAIDWLRS